MAATAGVPPMELPGVVSFCAKLRVMPAVAAVGATGGWPISGRAAASTGAGTDCAICCTGLDATIAAAGTCVAAALLRKVWIDVVLLIVVILVTLETFVTLTLRI